MMPVSLNTAASRGVLILALAGVACQAESSSGATEHTLVTSGTSTTTGTSTDAASDGSSSANFIPTADMGSSDTGPVDSYAEDVEPILLSACVIYCHSQGMNRPAGELDLDLGVGYGALVNVPSEQSPLTLVEPSSTDDSYLWHKLNGTHRAVGGSGKNMPPDVSPLPEAERARIETWISIGAPP